MTTSYNDFIGEVQHRIEAGTQADAVGTVRSVLTTLGERVSEGAATDIAAPLPKEIDLYLLAVDDHGQQFGFDEFIGRVDDRLAYQHLDLDANYGKPADIERSEVVYRTQAIVALLDERMPSGGLANAEAQLPEEFEPLFEFVDAEEKPWDRDE